VPACNWAASEPERHARQLDTDYCYGRKLTSFDIAADGNLSNRRVWGDPGDGVPDGIGIDADVAAW
jgi:hypothetical protein